MRAAGLSNLGSESCESSFRERNQKKLCRDPSLLLPWGATSPLSPGLLETLLFLAHEARQSNSPSLGLWMSSHILKPMFSNPMISSTSTFPRDKFHNQQEWFYDSCWNSNFFSLYQFSIFQTRRLKAERLSHTLKVTRLGSDLGVRSRIQTQKCLATKPDSRFSLSSFYSKNEEPITGLSSPSAAQVQGLLISEYLVSQVPVSGTENLIGQINCAFFTNQLCPGLAKAARNHWVRRTDSREYERCGSWKVIPIEAHYWLANFIRQNQLLSYHCGY